MFSKKFHCILRHCCLIKNIHICPRKDRKREFEVFITRSKPFHICALFTAIQFLKTLVRAHGTYKSPLTFDVVVLVEMFETTLNNAHIWPIHCFMHQL